MTARGAPTRQALLTAAEQLLLEFGFADTTGVTIRERAGVTHGSWMHAFPGGVTDIAAQIYGTLHHRVWHEVLTELTALGDAVRLAKQSQSAVVPLRPCNLSGLERLMRPLSAPRATVGRYSSASVRGVVPRIIRRASYRAYTANPPPIASRMAGEIKSQI